MIPFFGDAGYIRVTALVLNIVVAVVVTAVLRGLKVNNGSDITQPADYFADRGDPGVQPVLKPSEPIH